MLMLFFMLYYTYFISSEFDVDAVVVVSSVALWQASCNISGLNVKV